MKKPNFFIVGAPKSGTTSMCAYLNQHPDIFIPTIKEPLYFCPDLVHSEFTQEQYLDLFKEKKDNQVCGEGSVWYLYSKVAARQIKQFNSSAKIIIMLRDPVSLLYSLHSQFLREGSEDIQDFSLALEAESDRRKGKRLPKVTNSPIGQGFIKSFVSTEMYYYSEIPKFSEQIKRYFDLFDRENIHIINFDDFKSDTDKIYRETLAFIGVDPDFQAEFKVYNYGKTVKNVFVYRFFQYPPSWLFKLGKIITPSFLYPVKRRLGWRFLEKAKTLLIDKKQKSIDQKLHQKLKEQFKPEVEKLSNLLRYDLTYWNS